MHCPKCHTATLTLARACVDCGYSGNALSLERLSNLTFLLSEMATWTLAQTLLQPLENRYEKQKREVEISLGLRQPPPTAVEAQALRTELAKLTHLHSIALNWMHKGWLSVHHSRSLRHKTQAQINEINGRLQEAPRDDRVLTTQKRLMQQWDNLDFAYQTLKTLHGNGQIETANYQLALAELEPLILDIEYKAGMRPWPTPEPTPAPVAPQESRKQTAAIILEPDNIPQQSPRPPRTPWTWERFWDSLLSERTLKAILFLGALLLFASAVSWVASNWNDFSPIIQGTFLVSVTAVFYGLGWFVRVKQGLHESGVAISAVASFLVPLDFLVYYLSGGFPPESWPTVWVTASLVCFGLYMLMTINLQAEFFGYLMALAATSLTISILNWLNVPFDWWQIGAIGTALGLAIASEACQKAKADWHIFSAPLGRMALVTAVPLMLIGAGWHTIIQNRPDAFYMALAISWWLGGGTLLLASRRYQMRSLVLAAALAFPIAVYFSLDWPGVINRPYLALGWAMLTPFYLAIGHWLQHSDDERHQAYSRTVLWIGWAMVALSALWPLTQPSIARVVHLWLAATMVLAAYLWQQSRYLWLMSLYTMMAATMWQGSLGATPPEIALSWTLLAVLHVGTAVWLDNTVRSARFSGQPTKVGTTNGTTNNKYSAVLFGAGWLLAGLAILPPLLFGEQRLLVYALGNWIGVNGWLAFVQNGRQHPGLQTLLNHRWLQRLPTEIPFQWLTALSTIPWLGLFWDSRDSWARDYLPLAFTLLAWGLLGIGVRLRRLHWHYGTPWQVSAHISTVAALVFSFVFYEQWVFTAVLLTAAIFHFTAAHTLPRWRTMGVLTGGILLAFGWLSGLDWLGVPDQVLLPALTFIILAYMVTAKWLTDSGRIKAGRMEPLIIAALLLAILAVLWSFLNTTTYWDNDLALLWVSLTAALLGATFLLYAWETSLIGWGQLGVWAYVLGGGLLIKSFSRGSGRSALYTALLTISLVLIERSLHHVVLQPNNVLWRRAWRLYKRPLLTAAWVVSAITIGLALVRNLVWLGGGVARQSWSILALALITALYALCAYFYKKERFVWLASILVIAPWTLLANLRWYLPGRLATEWYGGQWVLLGIVLLVVAVAIGKLEIRSLRFWRLEIRSLRFWRLEITNYQLSPLIVAHILAPIALTWGMANAGASSVAFGLGVLFYGTAVWIDYHFRDKSTVADNRFLFPAAALLPSWAVYTLFWIVPQPHIATVALLVLAFSLPLLAAGRWLRHWQPTYQWPLYLVAYGTAVCATVLLLGERPFLIGVLLFNTGLAILSAYLFRKSLWLTVATVLFPWAAWLTLAQIGVRPTYYYGWLLIAIGAFYLCAAWLLRKAQLHTYGQPLLAAMFGPVALGIVLSSGGTHVGAMVGYALAAGVWGVTAVWLRQPILMTAVAPLLAATYLHILYWLDVPAETEWLASWPGILAFMAVAYYLDKVWGVEPQAGTPKQLETFPWYRLSGWATAVWQRLRRWWALPFHLIALVATFMASLPSAALDILGYGPDLWQVVLMLGLATAVFTYYLFQFRIRSLLLASWASLQFTYIAIFFWLFPTSDSAAIVALAFMPVTMATAAMGLLVQTLREEGSPFVGSWWHWWFGWSRPFFAILTVNLALSQLLALNGSGVAIIVTLLNGLIVGIVATYWQTGWLLYVPLALGWLTAWQYADWLNLPRLAQPTTHAVITALYGITGYAALYWQRQNDNEGSPLASRPSPLALWQRPLRHTAWFISLIALLNALILGERVLLSLPFAVFDLPAVTSRIVDQAMMLVAVFSILGLFYLATAVVQRRRWLGYGSVWLMFSAWSIWLLYVQSATELQYYALPASLYLFGVAWLEWTHGSRNLAAWIDRAAIVLMFGSALWQSFGHWGIVYALLMMLEGIALVALGSVRRLRRLLYAGVGGVVTAVLAQLIEPLFNLETYIFFILGAALLAAGILIEQRREKVLQFAHELKLKLEDWE